MPTAIVRGDADERRYLFVDGGYLRKIYEDGMNVLFGHPGELDLTQLHEIGSYRRIYYFDCIDDGNQGDDETDEQYQARLAKAEDLQRSFDRFATTDNCHIFYGAIKGLRRPKHLRNIRQKEVDVSFAVKALELAYQGHMDEVHILTGDQDFRPLVRALVNHNTKVTLRCFDRTTPIELKSEADSTQPISSLTLKALSTRRIQEEREFPQPTGWSNGEGWTLQRRGQLQDDRTVELYTPDKQDRSWTCALVPEPISMDYGGAHFADDRETLIRYFEHWYDKITWDD